MAKVGHADGSSWLLTRGEHLIIPVQSPILPEQWCQSCPRHPLQKPFPWSAVSSSKEGSGCFF